MTHSQKAARKLPILVLSRFCFAEDGNFFFIYNACAQSLWRLFYFCYAIPVAVLIFFGPSHTTPKEFENGALFLRLGLLSTLLPSRKNLKLEEFENVGFMC